MESFQALAEERGHDTPIANGFPLDVTGMTSTQVSLDKVNQVTMTNFKGAKKYNSAICLEGKELGMLVNSTNNDCTSFLEMLLL